MKPFEIPSILGSLKIEVQNGTLSIRKAAEELHSAGWLPYIDEEKAARLLGLTER